MGGELTDEEWTAIKPMLPNMPRGVPRVNDRRMLNATRSSTAAGLQRATISSSRTTLRSFNSRQSGHGCALMSPRPSEASALALDPEDHRQGEAQPFIRDQRRRRRHRVGAAHHRQRRLVKRGIA
jgi:transposase